MQKRSLTRQFGAHKFLRMCRSACAGTVGCAVSSPALYAHACMHAILARPADGAPYLVR